MDKDRKNIMEYETVALDDEDSALVIIDQTKLPGETELIHLHTGNLGRYLSFESTWGTGHRGGGGLWDLSAGEADSDTGL